MREQRIFQEICCWSAIWLVAFLASIARSARDSEDLRGFIRTLGLAGCSGFLSIGIAGLTIGRDGIASTWAYFAFGVAPFIGMIGPDQDKFVRSMVAKIVRSVFEREDKDAK